MDSQAKETSYEEKALWSKHYSSTGQPYYYNVMTGASQWEKPNCLLDEEAEVEEEWQQYVTEEGKPYWYNILTKESRWQNPEEEYSGDEEQIPPNPIEQFLQLLRDNKVTSNLKWDFVVKQLQGDTRWKCIGSISHKKKIFNQFLEEIKVQEQEENKNKLGMARDDFMKMLEEHKIMQSDIKLWKVQSYLVNDQRWKAIPDEKQREILFQDYLDKLYEQERDQMRVTRKSSTEDFRKRLERYIEIGVLNHQSTWDECLKLFSQDRLLKIMLPVDALGVFEEVINPLYEQWRQSIISKYRQNRINFRELLHDNLSEGVLTHKTKWNQFVQHIQQDDRFIAMLGQPGSQPHELFQDFIQHLKHNHQIYKSELKMHLQQKQVKSLINVSFEEVDQLFTDNQIWIKMPQHEQKYYFRYFQENIKQNNTSKRYKKLCKRYFKLLKSLPELKNYNEMQQAINLKIQENQKLSGLTEEQKKTLYEQFLTEPPIVDEQKKKKKEKKDKKEKEKKKEESVKQQQEVQVVEPEKQKQVKLDEQEEGELPPQQGEIEQEISKSKGKKKHRNNHKSKKHHSK